MGWFDFLKDEGYFDPASNPEPVKSGEGYQIPYWDALSYLDKLSLQIAEGKELDLIDELLAVIKNVSEHPKDNYRTWYLFIKFLSRLPNDKIPLDILNFIPVWFSGMFDTMLQTSELCEKLLPKFLNANPTPDDIEKAELICHHLLKIEKKQLANDDSGWEGEGESYYSRTYLYQLREKMGRPDMASKIATHFSDDFYLNLGRTLKLLLLDYSRGIAGVVTDGEATHNIKIKIEDGNLSVSSKLETADEYGSPIIISDFENSSEEELKDQFISALLQLGISYSPVATDEDVFQRLNFALNNDLMSVFGFSSIRKLDDKYSHSDKVLNVFAVIFRNVLDEKAKRDPNKAAALLKIFCYDNKYQLPFYKRIALYVINENWDTMRSLFGELIRDNDHMHLFSLYKYQKELYELLEKNQRTLTDREKSTLQTIIDAGEQEEVNEQDERHREYWQLRWYSALRNTEPFRQKYQELSAQLNITNEHYENLGELRIRSGSVSPISVDELLQKTNKEIADYIRTFQPKDRWEDPNISGLSDALGRAVEENPEKFASEIERYLGVSYIYAYRMLNAFGTAWKQQKSFDWENVLNYCVETLLSEGFYSGKYKLEHDGWNATPEWVVGSISNLLSYGMQHDNHALPIALLPTVKNVITITVRNLKVVNDFKSTNMDYPTYSLNSTAGKVLRALFDYSLFRARHLFKHDDPNKWEPEIKALFEETLQKGILDGNILEGMYFEQFYFLDKEWIVDQVKKHYHSQEKDWVAFINGFAFANAPFNKDIYKLFYPHYEKVIDNNVSLKSFHHNGLVRHLTAFYFWDYETIESKKLLYKFLNQATPEAIGDLIDFIWQQEDYQKNLTEIERKHFQKIIFDLWYYLAEKYDQSDELAEQKNLANLSRWLVFAPELSEPYVTLILKSCKYLDKAHSTHRLIEDLAAIINNGNSAMTAKAIGDILLVIPFRDYMSNDDQALIKSLVSFLFLHGQKETARKFCNQMAVEHQLLFLRDIYEKNMNT